MIIKKRTKQMKQHAVATVGEFQRKGQDHITIARDHDNKDEHRPALENYMLALDYFEHAYKYEKVPQRKTVIGQRIAEYLTRAEYLKSLLAGAAGAAPAGGTATQQKGKVGGAAAGADSEAVSMGNVIMTTNPNVSFDDIAGLDAAKQALEQALIFPRKFPILYGNGLEAWSGILFYGPPGTGKTQLARAVATEIQCTFISISSSDLFSKWQGQSEKYVREMFKAAREHKPSVLFIDEVDAILSKRGDNSSDSSDRVKTEFMIQMNGIKEGSDGKDVLILAATNVPWKLDDAILRRFPKRIWIPLPDADARAKVIRIRLAKSDHNLTDSQIESLADLTEGYSCADISIVVNEALVQSVNKYRNGTHFILIEGKYIPCTPGTEGATEMHWKNMNNDQVVKLPTTFDDFLVALKVSKPSVKDTAESEYEKWTSDFGSKS